MTRALATATARTPAEVRRDWTSLAPKARRLRVLELMQARNEQNGDAYPAREALVGLMAAHMTHTRGKRSPHTMRTYRRAVLDLFDHWHDKEVRANDPSASTWEAPGPDAGSDYRQQLEDDEGDGGRGLSPASVRVKIAAASAFYAALRWARFTTENPWADVGLPIDKTPAHEKRHPYAPDEIERLREAAQQARDAAATAGREAEAAQRHADLLIVLLGAHAGLRAAEMVGISWADVNLPAGELTVPASITREGRTVPVAKGGRPRTVPMTPPLAAALGRAARSEGEVLPFTATSRLYRRFATLAERAGLDVSGRGVHALRHSCATRLYRQTGDLGQAQQQLGHASVATTQRYAKADQAKLRASLASWT